MEVRQVGMKWGIGGQKRVKRGSKTIENCTLQRLYRAVVEGGFFLSPRANPTLLHKFLHNR